MTHTDHRMEAAQRSNQGKGRGYGFFPDDPMRDTPIWMRAIEVLARPSSIFSLSLLGLCVWLLINYGVQ